MVKFIKKRDGRTVEFDRNKIENAILGAMEEVGQLDEVEAANIAFRIYRTVEIETVEIETVQDMVENELMVSYPKIAKAYIKYRQERSRIRRMNSDINKHVKEVLNCSNVQNSNANVDEYSFGGRKNEASNVIQKDLALNEFIAPDIAKAHINNEIYIHDLSEYTSGTPNCMFADLGKLLRNGFATRNGDVRGANCLATACQLTAVVFQCSSMSQFGGIASSSLDYELAPFVRISFLKHYKKGLAYVDRRKTKTWIDFDIKYNRVLKTASIISKCNIFKTYSNLAYEYAIDMLEQEGLQSAQALYHNLNTLESRSGNQLPFTSINFGLNTSFEGRKITEWCLRASLDGIGKLKQTPIFPISIMKIKKDINDRPGTPNYDLRKLAIKSLCSRIYPNFVNSDWSMNKADKLPSQYIIESNLSAMLKVNIRIGSKYIKDITLVKLWDKLISLGYKEESNVLDLRFMDTIVCIDDNDRWYTDYAIKTDEHMSKINYICKNADNTYSITTDSFRFNINTIQTIQYPIPEYDYDTEMASMGSCDGIEVITYKLDNVLYVESFERAWERISYFYDYNIITWGLSEYVDTPGLLIYDSFSNGFTETKRIIKNKDIGVWNRVKLNGRTVLLTDDHPLPTQRGRVYVKDLKVGDFVTKVNTQYSEQNAMFSDISDDFAWLLGVIICDGQYQKSGVICSFGMDERELVEKTARIMYNIWGIEPRIKEQHRGVKGDYIDVAVYSTKIAIELQQFFEGMNKVDRHIPACVFNGFSYSAKCAFLSGMVDADGYIRDRGNTVDIGSTNPELAIQEALLAQSLGIPAKIGINYYKGKEYPDKIRYKVGIHKSHGFNDDLICEKKIVNNKNFVMSRIDHMTQVEAIEKMGFRNRFGYDVETESDHFDVSGINSHNCRTLIGMDTNGMGYKKTGRGNITPVTINLVKIGIEHGICLNKRKKANISGFFKQLNKMLLLAEKALLSRFEYIASQNYRAGLFMYINGVVAGADKCLNSENVYESVKHGTNALGYCSIAETCYALFGKYHNQDPKVLEFAIRVVQTIHDYAKDATVRNQLNFSAYATPLEGASYTICKNLQKEYGKIPGVCDREYITNSHHIPVFETVSIHDKIDIESKFTHLPGGGCISYVELESAVMNNEKAVEDIIDYAMSKDIPYLAINFPIDTCEECGYSGEILESCPSCKSTSVSKLRRVTGYLSSDYRKFNKGKIAETLDRVKHSKYSK